MVLKIKSFGNDPMFDTVADLQQALTNNYRGSHVSIAYTTKPHGMSQVIFVSVTDLGEVRHTHDASPVDFAQINKQLMATP